MIFLAVYLLYNIVLTAAFPILVLFFLIQSVRSVKYTGTIKERFGFYGDALEAGESARRVWVHAVSVGEAVGAAPLIKKLVDREGAGSVVVTTATKGGKEILGKTFGDKITIIYSPIDFFFVVSRTVKAINPKVLIIMETEMWPNLIAECARRGVPIILLNGRVSDRMWRAGRLVRSMYKWLFFKMSALGVQTEQDAERILGLGASSASVRVLGNMKFDVSPCPADPVKADELRRIFKPEAGPLFVAGSTHPGEEEQILDVFARLRKREGALRLVIAPRHIERADEVYGLVAGKGWDVVRRSKFGPEGAEKPVVILDTIGELRFIYGIAALCFIGGSLVERGGHNVLEPAACGKAVFYGPYMMNFTASVAALEENGGGIGVKNADELAERAAGYLADAGLRKRCDDGAAKTIEKNAGATERALSIIAEFMK